ncbi:hypothetical protein BRC62_04620 [Halobacteriales archaeon QH_10_67_13]|nr:MAG: hypothetical protein BRC62_04620 [Halobacteriales archaeon QH_10_67_13]
MDRLPGALWLSICTTWRYDPATDAPEPVVATAMAERVLGTVPTIGAGRDSPGGPTSPARRSSLTMSRPLRHGSGAGLWIVNRLLGYSNAHRPFETNDGRIATLRFVRQD